MGSIASWHAVARTRTAMAVAAGWGFAEATLFFVVPDVWIGLLALVSWRAGLRAVGWAVAGALVGGAVMYAVGAALPAAASATLLAAVPAVSPAMVAGVEREVDDRGPAAMLLGPLRGTPYKLYARAAGLRRQSFAATLLWTVPARGGRFLLVAAGAALWGAFARRRTQDPAWLVGPYLLAWVLFYAAYFRAQGF